RRPTRDKPQKIVPPSGGKFACVCSGKDLSSHPAPARLDCDCCHSLYLLQRCCALGNMWNFQPSCNWAMPGSIHPSYRVVKEHTFLQSFSKTSMRKRMPSI